VRGALLLNILAARLGESVQAIVRGPWRRFGRDIYSRHDYDLIAGIRARAGRERPTVVACARAVGRDLAQSTNTPEPGTYRA
jgi:hypothetical protein